MTARAVREALQSLPFREGTRGVPPRVIVGLGNPGREYARTRHNAGFLVLERLAERHGTTWSDDAALEARIAWVDHGGAPTLLLAPQTYMNRSGRSVEAAIERWSDLDPERDLVVVYDDLDLPTGGSACVRPVVRGGHRGMGDIQAVLGTKAIRRLRFGVGHPGKGGPPVVDYVLSGLSRRTSAASRDRDPSGGGSHRGDRVGRLLPWSWAGSTRDPDCPVFSRPGIRTIEIVGALSG